MAVEILAAEYTQGQLEATDMEATKSNEFEEGKIASSPAFEDQTKLVPIGSPLGANACVNGEKDVSADKFPKDAADEWPAQKEIHTFYFVKFRYYEDPKLKVKMEAAEKELQKRNQARYQLSELFKTKKAERFLIIDKLKPLSSQRKEFRKTLDEKRKEMEPLQAALGKLRSASNVNREKGVGLCSSEEELNERIQSLQYRIQHESNTLAEEKQLLKEIKQLEGTREKVIAHVAMQAKIQDSFGHKEVIQDHVKLIGGDMDEVRKEQHTVDAKIKRYEEDLKAIDKEISSFQEELKTASERRDKAYESVVELRKQRDDGNASYFQYRSLQTNFKDLAAKKDKAALEELSHGETEKFMALWNSSKTVRDDYEKKILPSLDSRQLSRDGRMRNPDEKPLISEEPAIAEPTVALAKGSTKHSKDDDTHPPSEHDALSANKVQRQKEENKKSNEADPVVKDKSLQEPEFVSGIDVNKNLVANKEDAAKLKELKRQEELAKAKLALERKKKLAEKAAAKAAVRAQKETEKKQKEREKKARRKVGATANTENEETSEDPETTVAEDADDEVEVAALPKDSNKPKETVRFRGRKGPKPVPKSILKKKQAASYWLWVVPSVLSVLLLVLVYYYFVQKELKN